jgi:hypothetical protein
LSVYILEVPPVFFDFYGGFSLVIFNFQGGSGNCSLGVLSAMRRYHAFIPCSRFLFWLLGRSCILHVALPVMFGALFFLSFSYMASQRSAVPLSALMRLIRLV